MNKKTCNLVNATPQYHMVSKKQNIPPSVPQDTQEPLNATFSFPQNAGLAFVLSISMT